MRKIKELDFAYWEGDPVLFVRFDDGPLHCYVRPEGWPWVENRDMIEKARIIDDPAQWGRMFWDAGLPPAVEAATG